MAKQYRVIRDVSWRECPWLKSPVSEGTIVYKFLQPTYGVVSNDGTAVCLDAEGNYPFMELPTEALEEI